MTGMGAEAIRPASQSTRVSSARAVVSSGGRASGRVSPANRTKSRFGSCTAASSAWSTAVSGPSLADRLASVPKPVTSSGLCAVANDGRCAPMAAAVSAENAGIWHASRAGRVGDDVAGAAGQGQHAHPPPARPPVVAEGGPGGQQFLQAGHPDDVELAQHRVDDRVVARPPSRCAPARPAGRPGSSRPSAPRSACPPGRPSPPPRANAAGSPISSRNRQITLVASSSTR